MSAKWSLRRIMTSLHKNVERDLESAREAFEHSGTKGDASEEVWRTLLSNYLPHRYRTGKAHIVDSKGMVSQQIDVVVYDRHYTPLIFEHQNQILLPAESEYAVFEAKQSLNAKMINYAKSKCASVRALYRTSLPIPHAGGEYEARKLQPILGGALAFESDWRPPMGRPLRESLKDRVAARQLDIGCIAAHGNFIREGSEFALELNARAVTAFILELTSKLQPLATVPMINVRAYAKWLQK